MRQKPNSGSTSTTTCLYRIIFTLLRELRKQLIKRGLRSSFLLPLGAATAGPGISLPPDNGRADYGRGGPGFQFFPFMAIFSTNSIICQSIRSFPKLPLYGTQSYVKWGGPVQRSLNLKFLICGCAVLEVHNHRLVTQKFFIKKYFFYHIFPFPYKKILNFIYASRSEKNFFICQLEKFYIFLPYIGRAHGGFSL